MAVGKSLAEVLSEHNWRYLTYTSGIAHYLSGHGITLGLWLPYYDKFPASCSIDVDPKDRPAIVAVKSVNYKHADHWVFWDGKQMLDPAPEVQDTYKILEVHFLTYWAEPSWLPELDDAQWWEAVKSNTCDS